MPCQSRPSSANLICQGQQCNQGRQVRYVALVLCTTVSHYVGYNLVITEYYILYILPSSVASALLRCSLSCGWGADKLLNSKPHEQAGIQECHDLHGVRAAASRTEEAVVLILASELDRNPLLRRLPQRTSSKVATGSVPRWT